VHRFGFSLSSVHWFGSSMVSLSSSFVDVIASYRSDMVLLAFRIYFGIGFLSFLSWRGFLFFNVVISAHLLYFSLWLIS
jgi:hypothetical protein